MDTQKKVFDVSRAKPAAPIKKVIKVPSEKADATFKVPMRSNLSTPVAEPVPPEVSPTERHELKIEPIDEVSITPDNENIEIKYSSEASSEVKNIPPVEVEEPVDDVPVKVEKTIAELAAEKSVPAAPATTDTSAAAPTASPDEPLIVASTTGPEVQIPTVFDTKQYHLPIRESKSHNAGKHMLGFVIVFLLIVILVGVVAIDAGWVDLGIKLPFDLIK